MFIFFGIAYFNFFLSLETGKEIESKVEEATENVNSKGSLLLPFSFNGHIL